MPVSLGLSVTILLTAAPHPEAQMGLHPDLMTRHHMGLLSLCSQFVKLVHHTCKWCNGHYHYRLRICWNNV